MQNFTLGKKGYSMLLFALVLLIGSSPSYGQTDDCPTVTGTPASQTFCFLATVEDIDSDGNAVYRTANNTTDTQPISESQLLDNDATYYVGSTSGTCSRLPVTTTVIAENYPNNRFFPGQNSFIISPCTPNFSAEDLATYFDAIQGYEVRVYKEEFGTAQASGPLTANDSYFVGQVSTTPTPGPDNCPSLRVAVGYDPQPTPAPMATSPQTFCDGATVADLEAQGTSPNTQAIRWYSSLTSFQPLPSNTILLDGATYYASQVINDSERPTPPCETPAADRTPVTVSLTAPIVINTPEPGTVCETDVDATFPSEDAIRNFYLGLLESGVPRDGTFSPTAEQIAQMYQNDADGLGDFTTTYTVGEGSCQSSVDLTVSVLPVQDANAGTIENIEVPCGSTDIIVLDNSLLSQDATQDGTFTGTGVNADGNFDPAVGPGTYTITYSVGDGSTCTTPGTSDTTTFDINVGTEAFDFGTPETGIVCEADVEATFPSFDEIRKYYLGLLEVGTPRNGTFNPTPRELSAMYQNNTNKVGDYTTTYTLGSGNCQSSVDLTVSVVPNQDAEAGTIEDIIVPCGSTDVIVLNDSLLSDDATTGGTFSGEGVTNGNFDPTVGPGSYEITYSVDDSANCVTPGTSDAITFTITVQGTDLGAPIELDRCITEIQGFQTNPAAAIALYNDALAEREITDLTGTFTPSLLAVAGQISTYLDNPTPSATFETTYSITSACGVSSLPISLTINNTTPADAGNIDDAIACTGQSTLNLFSLLNSSNPVGGIFTDNNGPITDGILNVSNTGTYNITYTVSESNLETCLAGTDSTDFTVTVSEGTTLPSPEPTIVCESDVQTLFPSVDEIRKFYRTLLPAELKGTTGTFNPSAAQLAQMYQDDEDGLGDFTTSYVVGNGTCSQIDLTVTIVPSQDANAGVIENTTACTAQGTLDLFSLLSESNISGGTFSNVNGVITKGVFDVSDAGEFNITYTVAESDPNTCVNGSDSAEFTVSVIESTVANAGAIEDATACTAQGTLDLFSLLSESNISGGTFSNVNGVITNGVFDVSDAGEFNITYTVAESDPNTCLSGTDSTDFTVSVSEGNADAGADNSIEVCMAEVDNFGTAQVRNLFLGLLEDDVDTNGTFNPSISEIIAQYQIDKIADFTTVYTVGSGACTDSATLTVTVNESTAANAGDNVALTFCSNENSIDLVDYLAGNTLPVGEFEGFEDGLFNPADNIGTTTFTYTVDYSTDDNVCTTGTDTASFTITVNELKDANAGGAITASYCIAQDQDIDLITILGSDALLTGSFSTPYENGFFNPSEAGVGVFEFDYTVSGADDCAIGTSTTTFTITVNDVPASPTADANQSFCLIDNPTVGDIVVTGDNIVIYTDADLNDVADTTTGLGSGMSYYAVSNNDTASCSSDATEIVVTITDPAAPALSMEGDEFCRSDNPTVQDLINNFSGSGVLVYTSSTGGSAISATTALQNGVTYYGASVNGTTGCESSERLAVVAKVEFCGIPEGFSPNGDGINDRFVIPDIAETFPNYSIEIFNRWGNAVFKGNASTPDWDGISNQSGTLGNDVLPVGVYFYILNYNDGQTTPVQGKLYLSI